MGGERRHSSVQRDGTARVLEDVRIGVAEWARERFLEHRMRLGYVLPDDEIDAHAAIAGSVARSAAADGIQEAYMVGSRGEVRGPKDWPTEHVRRDAMDAFAKKLGERRALEQNTLPADVITALSRIVGIMAKALAEEAISESHRLGVDKNATDEDHQRRTTPAPGFKDG